MRLIKIDDSSKSFWINKKIQMEIFGSYIRLPQLGLYSICEINSCLCEKFCGRPWLAFVSFSNTWTWARVHYDPGSRANIFRSEPVLTMPESISRNLFSIIVQSCPLLGDMLH
ncbi:hypothetical protein WUBG_12079 [Wuchereria bancrofti]|uniref:Uncharacterized protein n=1 Tax=Wuchereria bancrofti TaxID=6293 RepID=J9E412_WUCBA|nr:hypothetical protein WUBG_12079 [Wuchereria bancrofti]